MQEEQLRQLHEAVGKMINEKIQPIKDAVGHVQAQAGWQEKEMKGQLNDLWKKLVQNRRRQEEQENTTWGKGGLGGRAMVAPRNITPGKYTGDSKILYPSRPGQME